MPNTSAVPVSWHIGSTRPAEMQAFFNKSSATNRSFADASGSSRIARNCAKCPGRNKCDTSLNAWNANSLSASGLTRNTICPSHDPVLTPAMSSLRHGTSLGPSGNIGEY